MPNALAVSARALGFLIAEVVVYALCVAVLVGAAAALVSRVPFIGIATTPETSVINSVGLDLQSLKYILFQDALETLYAPSPPPSG